MRHLVTLDTPQVSTKGLKTGQTLMMLKSGSDLTMAGIYSSEIVLLLSTCFLVSGALFYQCLLVDVFHDSFADL